MISVDQFQGSAHAQHRPSILAENTPVFRYEILETENCIRLLEIKASKCNNDPLICNLSAIEVGQKPKYIALSYKWGSKGVPVPITLNGHPFSIGKNLHNALCYMRDQKRDLPFWVDAICINQDDIPERNHQLKIMHHIYMRANIVVVWLEDEDPITKSMGSFQIQQYQPCIVTQHGASVSLRGLASQDQEDTLRLAKRLYENDYWHRLWIIQEVAQAYKLEVCFGNSSPMPWGSFIELIESHCTGKEGPLRLERLRQEMSTNGCNLRDLLMDYREAKCEEPRDKIYGLVGLAMDSDKFPTMDYSKSLVEVWTDVMYFLNQQTNLSELDIISYGGLVKYLLIDKDNIAIQQILCPYDNTGDHTMYAAGSIDPKAFRVDGFVIGSITYVGPSVTEIFADLPSVNVWKGKLQTNYPKDPGTASSESNKLLHAILHQSQPWACFNHVSSLHWIERCSSRVSATGFEEESVLKYYIHNNGTIQGGGKSNRTTSVDSVHSESHLIQLRSRYPESLCKMAIASSHAKEGDLIVWVPKIRHAVVVRAHPQCSASPSFVRLQVYGTALLSEDVGRMQMDSKKRLEHINGRDSLTVQMDAATIFVLLAGNDGHCVLL